MSFFITTQFLGRKRGVTLLLAVLFLSAGLSIALGIFYVVYVQLQINRAARDSHIAFFSADAGKECALYYFQNYKEEPVEDQTTGGFWNPEKPCIEGLADGSFGSGECKLRINCADQTNIAVTHSRPDAGNDKKSTFIFSLDNSSRGICVGRVKVDSEAKVDLDDLPYIFIRITSEGQNSCAASSGVVNRTVEFCHSYSQTDCQ